MTYNIIDSSMQQQQSSSSSLSSLSSLPSSSSSQQQRIVDLEERIRQIEDRLPSWRSRIQHLEKNHPLEARLRSVEARIWDNNSNNLQKQQQLGEARFDNATDGTHSNTTLLRSLVANLYSNYWQLIGSPLRWLFLGTVVSPTTTSKYLPHRYSTTQQPQQQEPSLLSSSPPDTPLGKNVNTTENCVEIIEHKHKKNHELQHNEVHFLLGKGLDGYSKSLNIDDCRMNNNSSSSSSKNKVPKTTPIYSERSRIRILHREAVKRKLDTYIDPATGYDVFTSHHLKTRDCCGSSCRHCPWNHRNVPGKKSRRGVGSSNKGSNSSGTEAPLPSISKGVDSNNYDNNAKDETNTSLPITSPPPKSRLYTRKGDTGWGTLYNEQSIPKSDPIYHAIGDVDELNSFVGLARQLLTSTDLNLELAAQLETIQAWLLDVGSALCTPRNKTSNIRKLKRTNGVSYDTVVTVEGWIDVADAQLARLQNFILPGGSPGASALHCARSVCRRAERHVWSLLLQKEEGGHADDEAIGVFLNRLSDFLFVAARQDANQTGATESRYAIDRQTGDRWQRQVL